LCIARLLGLMRIPLFMGVGLAGADITPYIEHWKQEFHRVEVSRHLARYVEILILQIVENGNDRFDRMPINLRDWLRELNEGEYFLHQFMAYDGVRPFAEEFASAHDTLDMLCDEGL
jgi:hypothetical protein